MELLKNMADSLAEYRKSVDHILSDEPVPLLVTGLSHIHKAHFLASLSYENIPFPVLVITESEASAARLTEDINTMCGGTTAYQFPASDLTLTDTEAQSQEYEYKRIETLSAAISGKAKLIIASAESAVQLTVPKDILEKHTVTLKSGDEVNLDSLAATLVAAGYTRCDMIEGKGQFSFRGSLADIYPVSSDYPVRIELWGDEIDTVASFDIDTQRRIDTVKSVSITPCSETIFEDGALSAVIQSLIEKTEKKANKKDEALKRLRRDAARLRDGLPVCCLTRYFPLCYKSAGSIFDYANTVIVCESFTAAEAAKGAISAHLEDMKLLTADGVLCKGLDKYLMSKSEYLDTVKDRVRIYMDTFIRGGGVDLSDILKVDSVQLSPWSGEYKLLCEELDNYKKNGYTCVIFAGTDKAAKILADDLRDSGYKADYSKDPKKIYLGRITTVEGIISAGFEYPEEKLAVLTRTSASSAKTSAPKKKYKKGAQIRSLSDISQGDLVVHGSYGIGVFEGVQKLTADKISKDYIKIKYAGTDVLYVPVTQLDLISRYIGSGDADTVRLNKLGTDTWKKAKTKAKAATQEMAKELIELYSRRMKAKGYAFSPDTEQQHIFEDRFNYVETDDQLRCVEEIKHDMMRSAPMERLLCGDVGFGKTEVALRAAFKCIGDGKQCAVLVPTTVLAWQHYQTIIKRMEGFDIRIELLSRFRTAKEQKVILKKLEDGELDLVIGTHRLVQDDVKFKDLGLVIIDEEQRFGVNDKEKLKEAFTNVDVLTLSATPIPRTLNMAMSGIRDMSVIETPPGDRHPITTYVVEHDKGVIAQAINKELRRNGQVYYVHNRIESIYSCAADIHAMVPEANIGIAHGRMSEEELLDVWRRLIEGEINVLVCTTLIETGVDVPNCNTLIIENADCMGLAQLHQLRGRVGRTNRRAYAYFTFKRGKVLSEVATKRLDAIREFTRFGSGFRIAMKDLEIRGAGSVLGQSQSGHLASVGYDMYIKLLNEAILEQQGKTPEITPECLIDIRIDAFIPEKYISNQAQRVDCYRKIAMIENEDDAYDVTDELIDRYGDIPRAVEGLIEVAKLRRKAQKLHLTEIIQSGDSMLFYPENTEKKTMERVSAVGGKYGKAMMLVLATDKPNFRINGVDKLGGPLGLLSDVLEAMQSVDKEKAGEENG